MAADPTQDVTNQIESLNGAYSGLSDSLTKLNSDTESSLSSIKEKINSVNLSLTDTFTKVNILNQQFMTLFTNLGKNFGDMSNFVTKMTENFKNLATYKDQLAKGGMNAGDSSDVVSKGPKKEEEEINKGVEHELKSLQNSVKTLEQQMVKAREDIERISSDIIKRGEDEAKKASGNIIDKITDSISNVPIIGGFLGFILSSIILGVKDNQRLQAQKGEMKNAVSAAGGVFKDSVLGAVENMADFAEYAQQYLGISREEIQNYVKDLANAGVEINRNVIGYSESWKEVHRNIISLTLSLDKHLNLASGSSMKNVIELMKSYGYTLDEAGSKMQQLAMTAQRSGSDIQGFINAVMASSTSLAQYAIDIEDVGDMVADLQKVYTDQLGTGKSQMAGKYATDTGNALVNSLLNMNNGVLADFVKKSKLPGFEGMELPEIIHKFKTMAFADPKQKEMFKQQVLPALATYYYNETIVGAKQRSKKPEDILPNQAFLLSEMGISDLNIPQATAVLEWSKGGTRGGQGMATPEQIKELEKALKRRGETVPDLQKIQRDLILALKSIGEGMLMILTGILGMVTVGFKSLIPAIQALGVYLNPFSTDPERKEAYRLMNQISKDQSMMSGLVGRGVTHMIEGAEKHGKSALGRIFNLADLSLLKKALGADYTFNGSSPSGVQAGQSPVSRFFGAAGDFLSDTMADDENIAGNATTSVIQNVARAALREELGKLVPIIQQRVQDNIKASAGADEPKSSNYFNPNEKSVNVPKPGKPISSNTILPVSTLGAVIDAHGLANA